MRTFAILCAILALAASAAQAGSDDLSISQYKSKYSSLTKAWSSEKDPAKRKKIKKKIENLKKANEKLFTK